MNKLQYKDYLQSNHWINFQQSIYSKNIKCVYCGKKTFLNIHHLTYERLGKEKESDIVVLCRLHHFELHKGIISLKDISFQRDKRTIFQKLKNPQVPNLQR